MDFKDSLVYLFNKYLLSIAPMMCSNQNGRQSSEIQNPVKEADECVTKAEITAMKESITVLKKPGTKASEGYSAG